MLEMARAADCPVFERFEITEPLQVTNAKQNCDKLRGSLEKQSIFYFHIHVFYSNVGTNIKSCMTRR